MTCGACGLESFNKSGCLNFKMGQTWARLLHLDSWYYTSQAHLLFGMLSANSEHQKPSTLLVCTHIFLPLSAFFSCQGLFPAPRLPAPHRPFTTQALGRPSRSAHRGGYAVASGCCSGTAAAKAGNSARRFSSEAKWGNLGAQGEVWGNRWDWNMLTIIEIYIDRDYRDFQQNIEIVGFLLLEKNAFPIIEQWSNMKALRFIAALKQLGLKTIKYVHRMMRDMRRVLETMINHNVNGFLSEMVDLTIKNCG